MTITSIFLLGMRNIEEKNQRRRHDFFFFIYGKPFRNQKCKNHNDAVDNFFSMGIELQLREKLPQLSLHEICMIWYTPNHSSNCGWLTRKSPYHVLLLFICLQQTFLQEFKVTAQRGASELCILNFESVQHPLYVLFINRLGKDGSNLLEMELGIAVVEAPWGCR